MSDVVRDPLDLASLVSQRPEVDTLAACVPVLGQELLAVLRGADADVTAQQLGIALQ